MAKQICEVHSDIGEWQSPALFRTFFSKLDSKSKVLYEEKLSYITGEDPYTPKKEDFEDNLSLLPDLRCVLVC